jgi:hypothetical protein
MFVCHPSRPKPTEFILQRLWLTQSGEGGSIDVFNQFNNLGI